MKPMSPFEIVAVQYHVALTLHCDVIPFCCTSLAVWAEGGLSWWRFGLVFTPGGDCPLQSRKVVQHLVGNLCIVNATM